MDNRWRLALATAGLILALVAVALLAYAAWPIGPQREDFRPAPTLFVPPAITPDAGPT